MKRKLIGTAATIGRVLKMRSNESLLAVLFAETDNDILVKSILTFRNRNTRTRKEYLKRLILT